MPAITKELQQLKERLHELGVTQREMSESRCELEKWLRIKVIEADVREYIRWAKQQQGY